ncbi:NtaA/DmoA family FMN-dependent monooxygenase [Actinomycetospora sp. OC33-EN08]|uniref:NtaA/DmoA family FMN-dependent monooxygenase n=1 Tax=Actinomycetospora aurantiaca TaxID=3129233 RepID=A0ABU8MT75_9PSEU
MGKEILFNAISLASPSHQWPGLWAHPESNGERYDQFDFWLDFARTAERGLFETVFMADGIGVYDTYEGKPDAVMRTGGFFPMNDPMVIVPAMAVVTENLGFGITGNSTVEPPFLLARRFSTLDQLTRGRISWNVVTGAMRSVAKAVGVEPIPHNERYDVAEEYMDLMYKLWEQSWEDEAVVRDKASRVFADPDRIHKIKHEGRYACEAYHLCEPSPQRTPFLFAAGASSRGTAFAGKHAEAAFMGAFDKGFARRVVDGYRKAAVDAGRAPDDLKVFNAMTVIVAPTEAEAREIEAECREYTSAEGNLAAMSGMIGADLSKYAWDDPVENIESDAIQSLADAMTASKGGRTVRLRDLAEFNGMPGREGYLVGSTSQVCDELISWVDDVGVDGITLTRNLEPRHIKSFVDLVVPELQNRGRYKTEYRPGTLREKMFGAGPRLAPSHYGSRFRR